MIYVCNPIQKKMKIRISIFLQPLGNIWLDDELSWTKTISPIPI